MDRRRFLGMGGMAPAALLGWGRNWESRLPGNPASGAVDVRRDCGASGTGYDPVRGRLPDDTPAIQAAVDRALSVSGRGNRLGKMGTVYFPPGVYRITRPVVARFPWGEEGRDRRGRTVRKVIRRGLRFLGDSAILFVDGADEEFPAFRLEADAPGEERGCHTHDTRCSFENLWIHGARGRRPAGIASTWVNNVSVRDCYFQELGKAVTVGNATNTRIESASFVGCLRGLCLDSCRDSYVSDCYAFGCVNEGFFFNGKANPNDDGGLLARGLTALDCGLAGIRVSGQYTPMLSNLVTEYCKPNILIEGSTFGKLSEVWCGPSGKTDSHFVVGRLPGLGVENIGWNISAVNLQGEATFTGLQESCLSGILSRSASRSASGAALAFRDCRYVEVNATVRNTPLNSAWVGDGSLELRFRGGAYQSRLVFHASRNGRHVLDGPTLESAPDFLPAKLGNETGQYYLVRDDTARTVQL